MPSRRRPTPVRQLFLDPVLRLAGEGEVLAGHDGIGALGQQVDILSMPAAHRLGLRGRGQQLAGVLPDRLQHRVAGAAERILRLPYEAALDQRRQYVDRVHVRVGDGLRAFEVPAAHEDREPAEQPLLRLAQECVAPVDRRPQRLLAAGCVERPARQERQAPVEAFEQRARRQRANACGGQLDGERQSVEADADLRHRRRVLVRHREVRLHRQRPFHEQRDSLVLGQGFELGQCHQVRKPKRGHGELVLARDAERRAAGDEQLQRRSSAEQPGDERCRRQHLLQVVQQEQDLPRPQVVGPEGSSAGSRAS